MREEGYEAHAGRDQIVRAILAEMKFKIMTATPETRRDSDAAVLLLSQTLMTFTGEYALPKIFEASTRHPREPSTPVGSPLAPA